ncbi:YesL family protein [Schleiferilactobacillus shenzhenensis]|uniref:DUF624 domain-containing protein n=1 Tax=Schleiferilactobacillus shenzhenensis LY-73 TaxID=1231336 RepID=U4TPA6_9LACO|nr:YesL family protein [Schleiferilactobacillus shenzhenensis]ERL65280.1 hypothetical protein L248_2955 [Schleiferilactobacillus shenzhenensis LY-73]
MKRFSLSIDGPVQRTLGVMGDLIVLNMLWLLCSLPLVTIGAATTALYTVTLDMAEGKGDKHYRQFLQAFLANLGRGSVLGVLLAGLGAFLMWDYWCVRTVLHDNVFFLLMVSLVTLLYAITTLYTFPQAARFDDSVGHYLKNALFLGLAHMKGSLAMLAVLVVLVVLGVVSPHIMMMMAFLGVLFGFSGLAYLSSDYFVHLFAQYQK